MTDSSPDAAIATSTSTPSGPSLQPLELPLAAETLPGRSRGSGHPWTLPLVLTLLGFIIRAIYGMWVHPVGSYLYSDMEGAYNNALRFAEVHRHYDRWDIVKPRAMGFLGGFFFRNFAGHALTVWGAFQVLLSTVTLPLFYLGTRPLLRAPGGAAGALFHGHQLSAGRVRGVSYGRNLLDVFPRTGVCSPSAQPPALLSGRRPGARARLPCSSPRARPWSRCGAWRCSCGRWAGRSSARFRPDCLRPSDSRRCCSGLG